IRQRERAKQIPIIFITGVGFDSGFIYKGYDVGAVDYISKPFEPFILRSKVAVFADLYRKNVQIRHQAEELLAREKIQMELETLRREQAAQQRYRDLVDGIHHGVVWSADPRTLRFSFASPTT